MEAEEEEKETEKKKKKEEKEEKKKEEKTEEEKRTPYILHECRKEKGQEKGICNSSGTQEVSRFTGLFAAFNS